MKSNFAGPIFVLIKNISEKNEKHFIYYDYEYSFNVKCAGKRFKQIA